MANPFKFELKSLSIINPDGQEISLGSVIPVEVYNANQEALAIASMIEPNMSKEPNI